MRSRPAIAVATVLLTILASGAAQATVWFDDGGTHLVDYAITERYVYVQNATTVELALGGNLAKYLYSYDTCQIIVSGGTIGDNLMAWESTTVTMTAGSIRDLRATGTSVLDVSGGDLVFVYGFDDSIVSISGGAITSDVYAHHDSTVTISGGSLTGRLVAFETGDIIVQGTAFNYPYGPIGDLSGTLAGTLAGGQGISIPFVRGHATANIILQEPTVVPVPGALAMGCVGLALLARRRGRKAA